MGALKRANDSPMIAYTPREKVLGLLDLDRELPFDLAPPRGTNENMVNVIKVAKSTIEMRK